MNKLRRVAIGKIVTQMIADILACPGNAVISRYSCRCRKPSGNQLILQLAQYLDQLTVCLLTLREMNLPQLFPKYLCKFRIFLYQAILKLFQQTLCQNFSYLRRRAGNQWL